MAHKTPLFHRIRIPVWVSTGTQAGGAGTVFLLLGAGGAVLLAATFFVVPELTERSYTNATSTNASATNTPPAEEEEDGTPEPPPVTHMETPDAVRGIYVTACSAATPRKREQLLTLAKQTEINALIIDIKDFSGGISFTVDDEQLAPAVGETCVVGDMRQFIHTLHENDIYVIGRVTVFQDPFLAEQERSIAIKQTEKEEKLWRDKEGLAYIDPGAEYAWEYHAKLAEAAYDIGFDEINFDYIRYPSDGDLSVIYFPKSNERVEADPALGRAKVVRDFFAYMDERLPQEIVTSADLFGITASHTVDVGIGQILEYAAPYFDYIAPMVYPSHYPSGFNGWANPNEYPHEVVQYSMERATARLAAMKRDMTYATSTREHVAPSQLRPWLQDFDYGGDYDIEEVRGQIKATYEEGLDSWMLWSSRNVYTRDALEPFYEEPATTTNAETTDTATTTTP